MSSFRDELVRNNATFFTAAISIFKIYLLLLYSFFIAVQIPHQVDI